MKIKKKEFFVNFLGFFKFAVWNLVPVEHTTNSLLALSTHRSHSLICLSIVNHSFNNHFLLVHSTSIYISGIVLDPLPTVYIDKLQDHRVIKQHVL
jgi:hypothetical protein